MPELREAAIPLSLDRAAIHVEAAPGTEVIFRGSYLSKHDGSIVDARTTAWEGEPRGDTGGLVDFEAGGFYVRDRDPVTHTVRVIVMSEGGEACATAHVESPCLPLRLQQQATSRLMTSRDWMASLKGGISYEVLAPPVVSPVAVPYVGILAAVVGAGVLAVLVRRVSKQRAGSPAGQLAALAKRVQHKLRRADAVLSAPLLPAVKLAVSALRARRFDASSTEGKRVAAVLLRVEKRLDTSAAEVRTAAEQEAADDLVREIESALEAAEEIAPKPRPGNASEL